MQENQQKKIGSANTVDMVDANINVTKSCTAKSNGSFKAKPMVDSVEAELSTETVKAECIVTIPSASSQLRPSASFQPNASSHPSASPANAEPVFAKCTKAEDASFTEQRNGKHSKLVMLNSFGCEGAYTLPYEFRAKEIDEHQEQEHVAKQSSPDIEHPSGIHSDSPSEIYTGNPSDETRDPEEEEGALENYLEVEQDIVPVMQPSSPPNVFTKKLIVTTYHNQSCSRHVG